MVFIPHIAYALTAFPYNYNIGHKFAGRVLVDCQCFSWVNLFEWLYFLVIINDLKLLLRAALSFIYSCFKIAIFTNEIHVIPCFVIGDFFIFEINTITSFIKSKVEKLQLFLTTARRSAIRIAGSLITNDKF